ncbi:hypothetical protein [Stenoxybacter acetivorans]|uniref:hypothetical protein n=1 Tax=Stenoxybacter acetivorans TaxID=422441 RepID=UPI0005677530|nr:hypothetical protein [Stenoxybacter acetivorans]
MAENELSKPSAAEPPPRNRIRTIRIWLWVTAALFATAFFLSQCAMSKPQVKAEILSACIKNSPFNPQWADELAKHGLSNQSAQVPEPYCRCMWEETLDGMSTKQIEQFAKASSEDKLKQLGGETMMMQRHEQCLEKIKPNI